MFILFTKFNFWEINFNLDLIKINWISVKIILKIFNLMIFQIGWASLAAIFTFSIAMVVWGRNGDGSIDIWFFIN